MTGPPFWIRSGAISLPSRINQACIAAMYWVIAAQDKAAILQEPGGIDAKLPLGAHIRPRPQDNIEPLLLRLADVLSNVVLSREIVDARTRLLRIPEGISRDGIQAHRSRFAKSISPIGARDARVVHFS